MSITGANATFLMTVQDLFPTPQQLQGFAADDVFDTDPLASTEVLMGVDGGLSAGFVFVPVKQAIALQADSPSNFIFDTWYNAQQAAQDVFAAMGVVLLPGLGIKWNLVEGFLTEFPPIPNVKKLLQPRKFGITWTRVTPATI